MRFSVGLLLACLTTQSQAGLVLDFTDTGNDLRVSLSGNASIEGLVRNPFPADVVTNRSELSANRAIDFVWAGLRSGDDIYRLTFPGLSYNMFSNDLGTIEVPVTGDSFGVRAEGETIFLYFEDGFTQGAINGSILIPNTSFDDLGVNPRFVSWGTGADQNLTIVPEPASLGLIGLAAGLVLRRRKTTRADLEG